MGDVLRVVIKDSSTSVRVRARIDDRRGVRGCIGASTFRAAFAASFGRCFTGGIGGVRDARFIFGLERFAIELEDGLTRGRKWTGDESEQEYDPAMRCSALHDG